MTIDTILVGYIKSFKVLKPEIELMLSGQPEQNKIYRILQTTGQTPDSTVYQLYIGNASNKAGIDTLFLGNTLNGNYKNQWSFEIEIVDKENLLFLPFELDTTDLEKLEVWLNSEHQDLKELMLKKPVAVDMNSTEIEQGKPKELVEKEELVQKAINKVLNFDAEFENSVQKLMDSVNKIVNNDTKTLMVLADILEYLASTYSDKYEAGSKSNIAKEFLLNSSSSDTALFNTFKYIQRYSTKGFKKSNQIIDLYKALHYIMFELQRRKFTNE